METYFNYDSTGRLRSIDARNYDASNTRHALEYLLEEYNSVGLAAVEKRWAYLSDGVSTDPLFSYDRTNNFDGIGQLKSTPDGFDATGNPRAYWTNVWAGNRLERNDKYRFEYDGEGNLKRQVKLITSGSTQMDSDHRWDYEYDHANRLTKISEQWLENSVLQQRETTFRYDAEGNLVETKERNINTATETVTRAVISGGHVLADLNGSNQLTVHYLTGDEPNQIWGHVKDSTDRPMRWYVQDHQQSVVAIVDDHGAIARRRSYGPYGHVDETAGSETTRFGYRGDVTSNGLVLSQGKAYDAELGRWITESGSASGDTNPYRYLRNNPKEVEQGGSFFGAVGNFITGAWNTAISIPGQLLDTAKFLAFDVPAFALYEVGKARGQFGEEVLKDLGRNASSNMGSMAVHLQFASEEEQTQARLNLGTLGIYGGVKSLQQGDWKGVGEVAGGWLLPLIPKGIGAVGRISAVVNATQFIGRTAAAVARETAGVAGSMGRAAWSGVVHAAHNGARTAWNTVKTIAADFHEQVRQFSFSPGGISNAGFAGVFAKKAATSVTKPPLPAPAARIRVKAGHSSSSYHKKAAIAERDLAVRVHSLPSERVVVWGERIGVQGADVVSFHSKSGRVTLWDAKYRGKTRSIQQSRTFSDPLRRQKAVDKAIHDIKKSGLSVADQKLALDSLKSGNFDTRTVGAGKAINSVLS